MENFYRKPVFIILLAIVLIAGLGFVLLRISNNKNSTDDQKSMTPAEVVDKRQELASEDKEKNNSNEKSIEVGSNLPGVTVDDKYDVAQGKIVSIDKDNSTISLSANSKEENQERRKILFNKDTQVFSRDCSGDASDAKEVDNVQSSDFNKMLLSVCNFKEMSINDLNKGDNLITDVVKNEKSQDIAIQIIIVDEDMGASGSKDNNGQAQGILHFGNF